MSGLTLYDLTVIRDEGNDTRREIKKIQETLKETNDILMSIIKELVKLNLK